MYNPSFAMTGAANNKHAATAPIKVFFITLPPLPVNT